VLLLISLAEASDVPNYVECSIISLISVPDRFDGKMVQTYGVAVFEQERTALYASKEDAEKRVNMNAIWLDIRGLSDSSKLSNVNGSHVLVKGIFRMGSAGHLSIFNGSIHDISRLERWN